MVQINLQKFVTKKQVIAVLDCLAEEMGTAIYIEDAAGKRLAGANVDNLTNKYPIELAGEVIGWVLGEEKVVVAASLISYLVKQEFEKKALANELLDKYREITLLHDISTQITASLDLKEVAQLVIEGVGKLIECTGGSILLLNQKTSELEPLSTFGQAFPPQEPLKMGEGIIGSIAQTGNGEIVNDVLSDPRFTHCQGVVKSLVCVPLKMKEQTQGVIFLWSYSANSVAYTSEDLKILNMFAYHAAVAIEKALLYEQSCIAATVAQAQAQQLQQALYELQHTQAHLIQSEKMSSLGQLVAGLAHELNNPINFIHGNLTYVSHYTRGLLNLIDLYQQQYPTSDNEIQALTQELGLDFLMEDLPKTLSSMKVYVERIRKIVLSLQNFSRQDESEMKPLDIHDAIDSTLLILESRLKPMGKHSGIRIVKKYGKLPLVECYASQLNQVFMNILANAIDAVENQKELGIITIYTEVSEEERGSQVVIRIQDNGPGISEEVLAHLFDPFFTTKAVGKGTGLGLSISHQIIEKQGGTLKCLSQPGQGAIFSIQIPVKPTVMFQPLFTPATGRAFNSKRAIAGIV